MNRTRSLSLTFAATLAIAALVLISINTGWNFSIQSPPQSPLTETTAEDNLDQDQLIVTLKDLVEEHFAEDYHDPATHLAMLTDAVKYDRLIRIDGLLSLVMDMGIDLSEIERYGLTALENGVFEINHQINPGWRMLDDYLSRLQIPDPDDSSVFRSLLLAGMSEQALTTLTDYISNNDVQRNVSIAVLNLLEREIARVEAMNLPTDDREAYFREAIWLFELSLWESRQAYKAWALELMNQLEQADRELLFSVLSDAPSTTRMIPSPIEQSIDGLIEEINTGQLRDSYRQIINESN